MKEIIENRMYKYGIINIRKNTPVLRYLKNNYQRFDLQQVDHETFKTLKSSKSILDVEVEYNNCIAGYAPLKGYHWLNSGGLKVSDPSGHIIGSFTIEEKRVIYDPIQTFFEERDAYVYSSGEHFYTDMSFYDVLEEELSIKRKYLIYFGKGLKNHSYIDLFEEVSRQEFLEYAINPNKGAYALKRRIFK